MSEQRVTNSRYREFVLNNRRSMNESMTKILFFCALVGPVIALDRFFGLSNVPYYACVVISVVMLLLAVGQRHLNRYQPLSVITVFWGLIGLMVVLTFMCTVNVGIYITYALVPMVSLFYCEKFVYLVSVILNYLMILVSNALICNVRYTLHTDLNNPLDWFVAIVTGYTIESIVIGLAGYYLCGHMVKYFKNVYDSNLVLDQKERDEKRMARVASAVMTLYQCVYVIDLKNMTYEVVQRDNFVSDVVRDEDDLMTNIERGVFALVESKDKQMMLEFLNIKTLPARLEKESMIYQECMGKLHGRVQMSFILVEKDEEGNPASVVFTLRKLA